MTFTLFKDKVNEFTPVVLNIYDQLAPTDITSLLAENFDNRQDKKAVKRFRDIWFLPEAGEWVDQVEFATSITKWEWAVPMQGWQTKAIQVDSTTWEDPDNLTSLEQHILALPGALIRLRRKSLMDFIRQNALMPDNENMFSLNHKKPDGSPAPNVISLPVANPDQPTPDDFRNAFDSVLTTLGNSSVLAEDVTEERALIDGASLLAISYTDHNNLRLRQMYRNDKVDGSNEPNTWQENFRYWRDHETGANTRKVRFINLREGAPKVAVIIPQNDPVLITSRMSEAARHWGVVMREVYGVKPWASSEIVEVNFTASP